MPAPDATVAVIVAGGTAMPRPGLRAQLPTVPDLVVAADSGVEQAQWLGLTVDVVVGDLDSVDAAALAQAIDAGARVDRHLVEKDKTDLELALDVAVEAGGPAMSCTVVASVGGRLDHALANLLLLASPAYAEVDVDAFVDDWHLVVVRRSTRLPVRRGGLVTLLPVGGSADGVVTEGLRYPLRRETLHVGTTRGVSNEAGSAEVVVGLDTGVLLAMHEWPDAADPSAAVPSAAVPRKDAH